MYKSFEEFLLREGNITLKYFLNLWYKEDCKDIQTGLLHDDHPDARTLIAEETFGGVKQKFDLDIDDIIDCTLTWECTPEGYDFWSDLDNKWQDFLDEIPYENGDEFPFTKKSRNIEDFGEVVRDDINIEFVEELV